MIIISSSLKMRDQKEVAGTEKWGHLLKVILAASGRTRIRTQVPPLHSGEGGLLGKWDTETVNSW